MFRKGDLVTVKSYEKLKKKYGADAFGDIEIPGDDICFTFNMRQFCGEVFVVEAVFADIGSTVKHGNGYALRHVGGELDTEDYFFTDGMLSPVVSLEDSKKSCGCFSIEKTKTGVRLFVSFGGKKHAIADLTADEQKKSVRLVAKNPHGIACSTVFPKNGWFR